MDPRQLEPQPGLREGAGGNEGRRAGEAEGREFLSLLTILKEEWNLIG